MTPTWKTLLSRLRSPAGLTRKPRPSDGRWRRRSLVVERLEDRTVPSTFQMRLSWTSNGGGSLTVADGDPSDANANPGVITYIGTAGNFAINVDVGDSKPTLGSAASPHLDLSFNATKLAGSAADTLTVEISDTGFTTSPLAMTSQIGGTLGGSVSQVTSQAFFDNTNALFGTAGGSSALQTFTTNAFNATGPLGVTGATPYSLTERVVVTAGTGGGITTGNFETFGTAPPVDARISIAPSGTNVVGNNHTFGVLVEQDDGLPAGAPGGDAVTGFGPAPAGTPVAVTLTNTNGATTPTTSYTLTTDATGHASVTFTSPTAGTVVGNASTTFTVGGVSLTRDTDPATTTIGNGFPSGSGPATKVFEDEYVTIAPTATNEVGKPHTFTATVYRNTGDGTGFHAVGAGVPVTLTLTASGGASITGTTPTPGATTATTATFNLTTDAGGQVAVTFTSPTAGLVVGSATTTLTIPGGGSITRTTGDAYALDGPSANKYFISLNTVAGSAVVIGSGAKLTDTAVLAGGNSPTGTLTFSLFAPGVTPNATLSNSVYTDTVTVTGPGTYTTAAGTNPGGFLPTATGTYLWVAVYSGDANNPPVRDNGLNESQTVNKAGPAVTTTPGQTTGGGGTSIRGTKYLDLTGNGFSGDDTGLGGVTIKLYKESNGTAGLQPGVDTLVGTTTTAADGAYSFPVAAAGTYYVQEAVPAGYLQTGGGPNGTAGNTYYTVAAAAGTSYSGYDFDDFRLDRCDVTSVSYKVYHNGYWSTVSGLSGNTHQGDLVKVTFTVPAGTTETLTLVSYAAPTPYWSDANAHQQLIYQQDTGTFGPGTYTLTVQIPKSYYQVDFVCGSAIDQLKPNQNNNAYGPDSANILYHAQQRFISADNGGTTPPTALNTKTPRVPAPTSAATAVQLLTDSAVLSGGYNPTGTLTFYLMGPGATAATPLTGAVDTETVTVNGNGTYTTPAGYTPTAPGTYQWVVVYSGDANNLGVTTKFGDEPWTVQAHPTLTTTPGGTVLIGCGQKLTDSATLSGGYSPTGTLTFSLFAPGVTPDATLSNSVYTDVVTVAGNGTYTTAMGTNPGGFLPTVAGTYQWVVVYSGDANNAGATSPFGAEPQVAVKPSTPVDSGEFATIGFWHNKNGQALIKSFNSGPTDTRLGNWLAANFPHLFGASNPYTHTSLAGLTNAQVASVYANLWTPKGLAKNTYVQAFAVALGMYADDASLGYNATAAKYGFVQVNGGGGSLTYNIGDSGAAFGVPNDTTLTVLQIMQTVDANFDPGTGTFYGGNQAKTSAANDVLDGINTNGDIALVNSDTAVAPDGQPLASVLHPLNTGTLVVAVDALAGGQAAAEQARIDDAIATLNATLAGFGLTLVEKTGGDDPTADIHLHLADTSAIGGVANGVLGVTQAGGQITIVTGWNYFLGSDPAGMAANQYDFETVVMHELGHAVGLGHSTDGGSVMYPSLGTDQSRRVLTAADLAVIGQAEAGIEPLLAAGFTAPGVQEAAAPAPAAAPAIAPAVAAPVVAPAAVVPSVFAPVFVGDTAPAPVAAPAAAINVALLPPVGTTLPAADSRPASDDFASTLAAGAPSDDAVWGKDWLFDPSSPFGDGTADRAGPDGEDADALAADPMEDGGDLVLSGVAVDG